MLKRGTVGLLLGAIALTGGVLLLENQSGPSPTDSVDSADAASSEQLFPIEEEDISAFSVVRQAETSDRESSDTSDVDSLEPDSSEINASDSDSSDPEKSDPAASGAEAFVPETLTFVKNDDGSWQMTAPENAVAESGAIAYLLSQLTRPTARPIATEENTDLEEFGLTNPDYTVSFTANDVEYGLQVGGLDFAGDKRYVQAEQLPAEETSPDSNAGNKSVAAKIYAIPGDILNAVNRPTEEWLVVDETADDTTVGEPIPEDSAAEDALDDGAPVENPEVEGNS